MQTLKLRFETKKIYVMYDIFINMLFVKKKSTLTRLCADGGCDAYFGMRPYTDNINVPMFSYIDQQ